MAEKKLQYIIEMDANGAIKSMKRFTEETEKSGKKVKESGKTFEQQFDKITKGALTAYAAFKTFETSLSAFESTTGILKRFSGDISEARERTNGLASDLELMTAANKAAAAGLVLSAKQFADAAVASQEYAAATGKDATQALDELIIALASGEREGLKRFGLAVNGVTGNLATQRAALGLLSEKYGKMESDADSLAGEMLKLDAVLSNIWKTFVESANQAEKLQKSLAGVKSTGTELKDIVYALEETFADLGTTAVVTVQNIGLLWDAVASLKNPFTNLNWADGFIKKLDTMNERIQRAVEFQRKVRDDARLGVVDNVAGEASADGSGKTPPGTGNGKELAKMLDNIADRATKNIDEFYRKREEAAKKEEERRAAVRAFGFRERTRGGAPSSETGFGGNVSPLSGSQYNLDVASSSDAESAADAQSKLNEAIAESIGLYELAAKGAADLASAQSAMAGVASDAFGTYTQQLINSKHATEENAEAIKEAELSIGEILQQALSEKLLALGTELVYKGAANMLEGLALTITGSAQGPPLIGTGAAQVALGAGLGAVGVAISTPGQASPSATGAASEPIGPSSNTQDTGQAQTVIVQFTAPIPKDRVGQDTDSAIRAASRRDGTRRVRAAG